MRFRNLSRIVIMVVPIAYGLAQSAKMVVNTVLVPKDHAIAMLTMIKPIPSLSLCLLLIGIAGKGWKGVSMDYSEWYDDEMDNLKEQYAEEVAKDTDEVYEAVFFWDWSEEQILKDAKKARERFESWCENRWADLCESKQDI